jgi:hypothetical protein
VGLGVGEPMSPVKAVLEAADRWYREAWDTWAPGDGRAAEEALMQAVVAWRDARVIKGAADDA